MFECIYLYNLQLYAGSMKLHDVLYSTTPAVFYWYGDEMVKVYRPGNEVYLRHDAFILEQLKGTGLAPELIGVQTVRLPWWDNRRKTLGLVLSRVDGDQQFSHTTFEQLVRRFEFPEYAREPQYFVGDKFIGTQYLLRYP